MGFKLSYLVKGFPGHPLHPPLTDATIGAYTVATGLGAIDAAAGWRSMRGRSRTDGGSPWSPASWCPRRPR